MKKITLLAVVLTAVGISSSVAAQVVGRYPVGGYGTAYVQPAYGHEDLHRDLKQERKQLEREIRQAREALHQELKQDKLYGVPEWQRKAKHDAAHDYLKAWRRNGERELRQAYDVAHVSAPPRY